MHQIAQVLSGDRSSAALTSLIESSTTALESPLIEEAQIRTNPQKIWIWTSSMTSLLETWHWRRIYHLKTRIIFSNTKNEDDDEREESDKRRHHRSKKSKKEKRSHRSRSKHSKKHRNRSRSETPEEEDNDLKRRKAIDNSHHNDDSTADDDASTDREGNDIT